LTHWQELLANFRNSPALPAEAIQARIDALLRKHDIADYDIQWQVMGEPFRSEPGALRGAVVRVCFWRVPFDEIPTERSARQAWLLEQWQAIDDWIEAQAAGDSPGQPG